MDVTWIIEPAVFPDYATDLIAEITLQGHTVRTVPPFYTNLEWGDTSRYYVDFAAEGSCVICHASHQFCTMVAEDELWTPGTYGVCQEIDCSHYLPHFEDCLLNADYKLLTCERLVAETDSLMRGFGVDDQIFLRPDSGDKAFTGRLFDRKELTPKALRQAGVVPRSNVVVSRPKIITGEWRFVIADHHVVAASQYKGPTLSRSADHVTAPAREFAEALASREFQPDRVWSLDVCESEGQFRVVEINGFSCSRWYSCELSTIVSTVSAIAIDDWTRTC